MRAIRLRFDYRGLQSRRSLERKCSMNSFAVAETPLLRDKADPASLHASRHTAAPPIRSVFHAFRPVEGDAFRRRGRIDGISPSLLDRTFIAPGTLFRLR